MPHDSQGHVWIDRTQDPHRGVNFRADVAYVLGESSGDAGTLCRSAKVKMFSRKKPVDWSAASSIIDRLSPSINHPTDWFKGINGDFGIISASALTSNLVSKIDGKLNGWSYERDKAYSRILDFDGYYHNVGNPFDSLYVGMSPLSVAPGGTIALEYQLGIDITADDQIGLFDLSAILPSGGRTPISNLYAAVIIYNSNGVFEGWASAQETIGALQSDPAMHHFELTAPSTTGTYSFVPVLTTNKKTSSSQAISDIITIPGVTVGQFSVSRFVAPYMDVDVFVDGSSTDVNYGNKIYFYCRFHGGTSGGNFYNVELVLETSSGTPLMVLNNVQNRGSSGTVTVGGGQTVEAPSSTSMHSKQWSGITSLSDFIRNGGRARLSMPGTSTVEQYTTVVRVAAALPGRTEIPF